MIKNYHGKGMAWLGSLGLEQWIRDWTFICHALTF